MLLDAASLLIVLVDLLLISLLCWFVCVCVGCFCFEFGVCLLLVLLRFCCLFALGCLFDGLFWFVYDCFAC